MRPTHPNIEEMEEMRDVGHLADALAHSQRSVREAAAAALARIGDSRGVEPLIAALQHSDCRTRSAAAKALGSIGDARAVAPLTVALGDRRVSVMRAAAHALASIGDERAVDALAAALRNERWQVRRVAVEALGKAADARACELLAVALQDQSAQVRAAAVEAVRRVGLPEDETAQAWYAVDARDWQRAASLGRPAVAPLVLALRDWDEHTRMAAARALARIGADAVGPLAVALRDWNQAVCLCAAQALAWIGAPASKTLVEALSDERPYVREAAATALEVMELSADPEVQARRAVAMRDWQLAASLGPTAVDPLIVMLREGSHDDQIGAAWALTRIARQALEPLVAALGLAEADVRIAAAGVVKEMSLIAARLQSAA